MSFLWTTVWVSDLDESISFYREIAGLEVERRFSSGKDREIAFLVSGEEGEKTGEKQETKIELMEGKSRKEVKHRGLVSLGFEVKSLDEKIDFLKKQGIEIYRGPVQPNPEIKFLFVKDPDGMLVQFAELLN